MVLSDCRLFHKQPVDYSATVRRLFRRACRLFGKACRLLDGQIYSQKRSDGGKYGGELAERARSRWRQRAKSAVNRRAAGLLNNKTGAGAAALNCKTRCNVSKTHYN